MLKVGTIAGLARFVSILNSKCRFLLSPAQVVMLALPALKYTRACSVVSLVELTSYWITQH